MISTLSVAQALDVWADIEDTLHGEASHGSVCEIYAYRLVPSCPAATAGWEEARRQQAALAAQNLTALVAAFCERREARAVLMDGRAQAIPISLSEPVPPFDHRVQVFVVSVPVEAGAQASSSCARSAPPGPGGTSTEGPDPQPT